MLIVSLVMGAILGTTLASYLILVRNQETSVVRSQVWNQAIAVAEAGLEEGMSHLNSESGLNHIFAANGWTLQPDGTYQMTRFLDTSYYTVVISIPSTNPPVITSTGYVPVPVAAVTLNPDTTTYISRTVQVVTRPNPLMTVALAVKQQIDFKGSNNATDSFDSGDTNYCGPFGMYDKTKTKANGDVVTDYAIVNSINVGSAKIKGTIRTGPGGTTSIGSGGSVGDSAWVNANTPGIQSGHFYDDMNVIWPDITFTKTNYVTATPANTNITVLMPSGTSGTNWTTNTITFQYYLPTGNYQINNLSKSVYIDGVVNLYVPPGGKLNWGGGDVLYLAQDSISHPVSLNLFCGASTATFGGNGSVNRTGKSINATLYGLSTCTAVIFSANAAFTGLMYAPEALFTLGGGGSDTFDFVGAAVCFQLKFNGNFNFHYDEALRRLGPGRGYVVDTWKEI